MKHLDLTVHNRTSFNGRWPVAGGVPLAMGAAPAGAAFTLTDGRGRSVPLQTRVLATWPDGSARWVLLDFQSEPHWGSAKKLRLTWGTKPVPVQNPVRVRRGPRSALRCGSLVVETDENALLRIGERSRVNLTLTDARGRRCRAKTATARIENAGPLQATLALAGSFFTPAGERVCSFRLRACLYAGQSHVRLEPMILADSDHGVVQRIRELALEFEPLTPIQGTQLGGQPADKGAPRAGRPVKLFQVDDEHYRLEGAPGKGKQAPGWVEWTDAAGPMAVALRDFWQQWPKAIEAGTDGIRLGLLPAFQEGAFDHMGPWYKHGYLFEGSTYRLRTGQARRWQVWVGLEGKGAELAAMANQPLVPAADPAQAIATGAWGTIAPAGTPALRSYDRWAEEMFGGYRQSIAAQRDYGAMNWGDWFGERAVNWGNHEYDTPLQMLTQFARTGNPDYLYWGDTAARHLAEVDVVHHVNADLKRYFSETVYYHPPMLRYYPPRPGMVHEHAVGHVGGFYSVEKVRKLFVSFDVGKSKRPYLCLDPFNLGHVFTEGMARQYFLTGDPWVKETVEKIGDNLAKLVCDGVYPFFKNGDHSGRVNGWTMLAIAGAFDVTPKREYRRAMRLLADAALSEQDPICGGWLYELPYGHCYCKTRKHVGEAGFLTGVRLNGMARYFELTGDPRIPDALRRAIDNMNRDTWNDRDAGWRYTSCPASARGGRHGVQVLALARSVRLHGDPEQKRILRKVWENLLASSLRAGATLGAGKAYSAAMYGTAEAAAVAVAADLSPAQLQH